MTPEHFENMREGFLIQEARILDKLKDSFEKIFDGYEALGKLLEKTPAEVALTKCLNHIPVIRAAARTGKYDWGSFQKDVKEAIVQTRVGLLLLAAYFEYETNNHKSKKVGEGKC
jgi:hypothetical protein